MSWTFSTAEYYARDDSPRAYGRRSRRQYFSASLTPWSAMVRRFQHCSVSGFPLLCLKSCIPYIVVFHGQERVGPPKFFNVSLPACHGLRTPADLHILATTDALVLPSVCVKTLGVRNKRHFEAVPALQGTRLPLRPTGFAVYASPILFTVSALTTPPWTQDALRVGG